MIKVKKSGINSDEKEAMPFFIIVIGVMIFLYGLTIYTRADLQEVPAVIVFSAAMGIHAALHWFYRVFSRKRSHVLIYFYIQTAIAVFLVLYSKELSLVFGLFLPLLGEEVGIFRSKKAVAISILANSALIAGSLLFYFNSENFDPLVFVGIIPLVFFVIIYVNLYNRQSDAKQRAENLLAELETANGQLKESKVQIEKLTIEQERQRIARELHDTLAQGLSGVILQLEAADAHLQKQNGQKAGEIVSEAMSRARETLAGAREAIDGLRSAPGGTGSLLQYINSQQGLFSETEMKFSSKVDTIPKLTGFQQNHIEKIISEGLANSLHHSEAKNVLLELESSSGELVLRIGDDGRGFIAEKVPEGHYGLEGMRERCGMLGGSLIIDSSEGAGTLLTVRVPIGGDADE